MQGVDRIAKCMVSPKLNCQCLTIHITCLQCPCLPIISYMVPYAYTYIVSLLFNTLYSMQWLIITRTVPCTVSLLALLNLVRMQLYMPACLVPVSYMHVWSPS